MKMTKLLSVDSLPAPALLARAPKVVLTFAERQDPPAVLVVDGGELENAIELDRPIEVGDAMLDEDGNFYVVAAAVDTIMKVSGDIDMMQEAVYAFSARGIRIAPTEDGFSLMPNDQFKGMLENVGLTVTMADEPFVPVPLPRGGCGCGGGGCGCGGHGHDHHHHEGGCGCGGHGHDHHHEGGCGCGGHGHDHHHEGGCGCGGHGHDHHHEGGCGCGGHDHHHHEGGCCCGGHEEKSEGSCCCSDEPKQEAKHEGGCCCGNK